MIRESSEFTDDESLQLSLLQHDKRHVGVAQGQPVPAIEKALRIRSEKSNKSLFRGLTKPLDVTVGKKFKMRDYSSFSESDDVALRFAKGYGSKIVLELDGATGFCYWKWLVEKEEKLRAEDQEAFDAGDGYFMIEAAKEEAEWIIARNTEFTVLSVSGNDPKIVKVRMS